MKNLLDVGQNSRGQTFGSLYREVRYIRASLYRDSTVDKKSN